MSYSRSDTVKILRSVHKVVLRRGMTRREIDNALAQVPKDLRVTDMIENDELGTTKLEFLEECEERIY